MTHLPTDPRYINMRSGMVACIAVVNDAAGDGRRASDLLVEFAAPRIGPLEVLDVMASESVEGSTVHLEEGWRLAMCQLARLIDADGDFELSSRTINRKWSGFCVDALRHADQAPVNPVEMVVKVFHHNVRVTVYQDRTDFGPLFLESYAAVISDSTLGRFTVRHSTAIGRTPDEVVERLKATAEMVLRLGMTIDLPYAHIVVA